MDRPTKEVKLPVSGYTATVVTYFNRGELVEQRRILAQAQKLSFNGETGEPDIEVTDPEYKIKQEDAALKAAVTKLVKGDEAISPVGKEVFDSLPDEDVEVLLEALPGNTDPKEKTS